MSISSYEFKLDRQETRVYIYHWVKIIASGFLEYKLYSIRSTQQTLYIYSYCLNTLPSHIVFKTRVRAQIVRANQMHHKPRAVIVSDGIKE